MTYKSCPCPGCPFNGKPQLLTEFPKDQTRSDGRRTNCKTCQNRAMRNWKAGRKFCSYCKRTHPITDFHENKASKDGKTNRCKKAYRDYNRNGVMVTYGEPLQRRVYEVRTINGHEIPVPVLVPALQ